MAVHDHTDVAAGQPLCPDCYHYTGHLIWQWWAPELWRRFTITLRRRLAHHLGVSETAARERVRVQFAKVAEFQRRIVHFHALIRLDGPPTDDNTYPAPQVEVTSTDLADLIREAAGLVRFDAPPVERDGAALRLAFGVQLDARPVTGAADRDQHGGELHPETVAAYIAKYATKAASDATHGAGALNPHVRRLRTTLDQLQMRSAVGRLGDDDQPYKGWGRWADMLGFRGHLATKSRRYSVTLGRLRQARRDYTRRRHLPTSTGSVIEVGETRSTARRRHWWSAPGGSPEWAG